MGAQGHDGLAVPGRVVLAREPAFSIGQLRIDPPTRQVRRGDRSETLEPRVMQVLVALARAKSEIVTRDELIDTCWDGRVVGDDSINRVLSRIRRVAAEIGNGTFSVETVPRVGYRLGSTTEAAVAGSDTRYRAGAVSRRSLVAGAVATAALAAGAAGILQSGGGRNGPSREAQNLYAQALAIRQNGSASDNRQALAYLREAVRLSPEYGQAWGALALAYRSAINNETPERVAGFEERLGEAVRNAERLDPGNADAAAALLPSKNSFGRWGDYEPIYRSAIRRHPSHFAGYSLLGNLLMDVGRWSDAAAMLQAAKVRNPSSPPQVRYRLIVSLWSAGRISEAEDEVDRAVQLWPQHGAIWQTKIKLLALTGRPKDALMIASDPAAKPLNEADAPNNELRLLLLTALAMRSRENVDRAIDAMVRHAREVEPDRVTIALYSAALGRTDLALNMLEGVYLGMGEWARRSWGPDWRLTHPLFQPHAQPLWPEPRFDRILSTVGLVQYWRATGTLPDYRR